jgi:hypothetical protein
MRFFNALQVVVLFSAWPMLINWLAQSPFRGADVLYYVAWVAYAIGFVFITASVADSIENV